VGGYLGDAMQLSQLLLYRTINENYDCVHCSVWVCLFKVFHDSSGLFDGKVLFMMLCQLTSELVRNGW
jgi:hypothetical protein